VRIHTHIAFVCILASSVACAQQKHVGLSFFRGPDAPIRWPRKPGQKINKLQVSTLVAQNRVASDGSLYAEYENGIQIQLTGLTKEASTARVRSDRGFYTNLHFENRFEERHIEFFRSSPIISVFDRTTLSPPQYQFSTATPYNYVSYFDAYQKVTRPLSEVVLRFPETVQPFVLLHDQSGESGILLYFPHAAEQRKWFTEDYTVLSSGGFKISPKLQKDGLQVHVRAIIDVAKQKESERTTYDAPIMMMPFADGISTALRHFQLGQTPLDEPPTQENNTRHNYWSLTSVGNSLPGLDKDLVLMRRYAPEEFTSWIDSSHLANGHKDGLAWGFTTMSMKVIRVNPLANQTLFRDHALRMLSFFLETGREKGAPPLLVDVPSWSSRFPSPELIYTVVFCQFWEFRLEEFRQLLQAPYLLADEKDQIYEELQRAKVVYDPQGQYTWSLPAGANGLWFDYFDLPLKSINPWIINTHATSVNNVALFIELAKDMNRNADATYWTSIFRRGLEGLFYATDQDWMWLDKNPNELKYGRHWNGPSSYHKFMVTAWLPEMLKHTKRLAPDLYPRLLRLFRRCAQAKMLLSDPSLQSKVKKLLEKFSKVPEPAVQ